MLEDRAECLRTIQEKFPVHRILKYGTDKHIVQILYEKPLGAAIYSYLWVPYVSKILSQDKKNSPNFAKFLVDRKIFVKKFLCDLYPLRNSKT